MSARHDRPGLVRRPSRAVPVALVGIGLLVLGILGLWLLGTYVAEGRWPMAAANSVDAMALTTLESLVAQAVAGVLAVLGLALLLAAAWPGRPSRLVVLEDDIPGETAMSRRDLARYLESAAGRVDGAHSASVSLGRRRIDAEVVTVVDDPAPVIAAATHAVDSAVDGLRPAGASTTRVRARRHR